ncbi:MAG TPA: zinc ribbon domain-containing protein [Pyrinomonadaceae bacterium]|jgi:hypothetical protein|nr:zinc ribbon domain-containing protein [Pyrinomonadaceae bacterium]
MADKQCPECGETVDEAKAFCPGCGHAFVEEKQRTDSSAYQSLDHTQQMGQTMYNAMLSDMGLNISTRPDAEKRVEVLTPVASKATGMPKPQLPVEYPQPPIKGSGNRTIWILVAVGAVAVLLALLVIIAAAGILFYYRSGPA